MTVIMGGYSVLLTSHPHLLREENAAVVLRVLDLDPAERPT
jgi:hypothetical protein